MMSYMLDDVPFKKGFCANKNQQDTVNAHAIAIKMEVSVKWLFYIHSKEPHCICFAIMAY